MAFSTIIDPLYCQEEHLDFLDYHQEENEETESITESSLVEEERQDNLHLLHSLCRKETETNPEAFESKKLCPLGYLLSGARRDMVAWLKRAVSAHGFTTQTALLSVNYLDRCFLTGVLELQPDKPWMGHLAAVACLSLAAKVEETRVPSLLDLQLPVSWEEETGTDSGVAFLFEAKTVRRMELLVLSVLQWRLNSVTALSFIQLLASLLCSERCDYLTVQCEGILLSVLDDCRWVKYAPSVWASATLLHALEMDETERIKSLINVPKDKVKQCYDLIQQLVMTRNRNRNHKRKHFLCELYLESSPASPDAVIDTCFSCENSLSSNDSLMSWPSSVPSSPERPAKRFHYSSIEHYKNLLRDEESRQAWEL